MYMAVDNSSGCLKMSFILNGETRRIEASMLLCCSSAFLFFLLLIGLKAVLVTMASREEITVCEDEVR